MDFDHDSVRQVVEEDRLSSLPDELIHKILSSFDMKFAVQTCVLSSRWEFLWTSMPCVNFSSEHFDGELLSQVIARKIADYAFSHNIQELIVVIKSAGSRHTTCPPCLFSSHSQALKHFTLRSCSSKPCVTPKTPWDFPALTTLHLSRITLCDDTTQESVDLFSKCVNLKNLTLESISLLNMGVFDIIAPQLEKLTVIYCSFKYLNAPPGLTSLYYKGSYSHCTLQLCKDRFHSLNKVTICLYYDGLGYKEHARKTINMLQELHSARYLTLDTNIIERISSFPDMLSHHPSPFSNLICLTINSRFAWQVEMPTVARNFFLENSPNAALIWELPRVFSG